jgi:hypothetical protein
MRSDQPEPDQRNEPGHESSDDGYESLGAVVDDGTQAVGPGAQSRGELTWRLPSTTRLPFLGFAVAGDGEGQWAVAKALGAFVRAGRTISGLRRPCGM